ncbi:MAG: patatin-like phospholipase family protein [Chloroflexota bacterium]
MRRRTFISALSAMAPGALAAGAGAAAAGRALAGPRAVDSTAVAGATGPYGGDAALWAAAAAGWDDGLAHPIPYTPKPGAGLDRGLVLSGGGMYMLSFHAGYLGELQAQGIDLTTADIVVGTSVGATIGAMLLSGQFAAMTQELDALGEFPWIFAKLIPNAHPNPSQIRGKEAAVNANAYTPAMVQSIGRAALAANNPSGPEQYHRVIGEMLGITEWPSPKLHFTTNDCFTGERLVMNSASGVPLDVACAASGSLPGQMGPTWVKNRACMDGAMSCTNTHADVVAGVKRALIISLTDGGPEAVKAHLTNIGIPNSLEQEIAYLEAGGTKTMLVVAGLLPGETEITSNLDPAYILPVMAYGKQRATEDADRIKAFWA